MKGLLNRQTELIFEEWNSLKSTLHTTETLGFYDYNNGFNKRKLLWTKIPTPVEKYLGDLSTATTTNQINDDLLGTTGSFRFCLCGTIASIIGHSALLTA